jgi:DNA-binding SARP family transcriptional activator
MNTRAHATAALPAVAWQEAFEVLPEAALVLAADGRLLAANAAARALLGRRAQAGARCCDLLGCRPGACLAALAGAGESTEHQVALADGAAAWATAATGGGGQVVVTLHRLAGPAGLPREDLPPRLVVHALGRTRIEGAEERGSDEWLGHRPGQVLKYLVCERGRVVPPEELLEVFWPHAGRAAASSVRQAIHTLRDRLEPGRPKHRASGYVLARPGGYELAPGRVAIDADDFEAHARAGLAALARGEERAHSELAAAAAAYGGSFLADEPYAEWALAERARLQDVAAQVLRGLVQLTAEAGDADAATEHLQRLVELEPLDLEAQRHLLEMMISRGRHSEAARRYELVRRTYRRTFGTDPALTLEGLLDRGE